MIYYSHKICHHQK